MAEIALAGANAVLRQTVGVLGNLAVQEGSRLSRLREDIVWIESEMRHMEAYLEDAEAKQGGSRGVANLIIDIRDLALDVEDIMQKYFPQLTSHMRKGFWGSLKRVTGVLCCACAARDFVIEIEEIKRRVENINRVRLTYGINECSGGAGRDVWDERRSFPHVDEPNVVGFEKHISYLVAKMCNEGLQCRVISIVGMAGLGKTTLARKVYNSIQHRFRLSAWIYVSQQPNIKELLQDIARQVRLENEKWEGNFETNLYEHLSEHRYVLVIDDIWNTQTWDAIKNVIPTNTNDGSRIILTSRNTYVGTHVGGNSSLHVLQPLNQENSKKLFFKMVMGLSQTANDTSDPPQLENIGEKILKRCGGVPLAIILAAGLLNLRERSENSWKGILESMGQDEDQCSEIFALSYKDLPTKLKPCFLYFGLFPEDHEISTFELINLWAAEGFIQGSGVREVEDVGDDYLNHLIARNLIQVVRRRRFDGRVRSCRIHDILHSLCIRVAKEINFSNTRDDITAYNPSLRARRFISHGSDFMKYISSNYQIPKLRAMMCFGGSLKILAKKSAENFLQDLEFLRVLSVKCDCLPSYLPNDFGNLRHLSYLGLRHKGHESIELPSTISNLKSLLTLDVREFESIILPNVIWNMKQLRHILLPLVWKPSSFDGDNLNRFHPIAISLPNLQTLYGFHPQFFEDDWLRKVVNLRTLKVNCPTKRIIDVLLDATPVLHKLEKLRLTMTEERLRTSNMSTSCELQMKLSAREEILRTCNMSRHENLRSLHLDNVWMIELPQLPLNLTKLTLKYTALDKDPMETLNKLPKLKILKLRDISYSGKKMVCSGGLGCNFPELEVLEIKQLRDLEELIVEEGGMPRLKDFRILECNPRTRIPNRIRNRMRTTNNHQGESDIYPVSSYDYLVSGFKMDGRDLQPHFIIWHEVKSLFMC